MFFFHLMLAVKHHRHVFSCVSVHRVCFRVSLRCLRAWSFQRLGSGGIPASSAFSREKLPGSSVSPTAKPLKLRSHSNLIFTRGSTPSRTHLYERNGYSFLKSVYCLSGLGIVRKNRRIPKHLNDKKIFLKSRANFFILNTILSLRFFNHEFTRFKKKYYPWSD